MQCNGELVAELGAEDCIRNPGAVPLSGQHIHRLRDRRDHVASVNVSSNLPLCFAPAHTYSKKA